MDVCTHILHKRVAKRKYTSTCSNCYAPHFLHLIYGILSMNSLLHVSAHCKRARKKMQTTFASASVCCFHLFLLNLALLHSLNEATFCVSTHILSFARVGHRRLDGAGGPSWPKRKPHVWSRRPRAIFLASLIFNIKNNGGRYQKHTHLNLRLAFPRRVLARDGRLRPLALTPT